ncbi:MAG: hypothetical protein P8J91_11785 [Pirellulaceae bacterium]|nr:hypothetical protein [Pirellulaceae bacterium]MDG2104421.1 hypothetical protein [Pirellulaceae bacterium]
MKTTRKIILTCCMGVALVANTSVAQTAAIGDQQSQYANGGYTSVIPDRQNRRFPRLLKLMCRPFKIISLTPVAMELVVMAWVATEPDAARERVVLVGDLATDWCLAISSSRVLPVSPTLSVR